MQEFPRGRDVYRCELHHYCESAGAENCFVCEKTPAEDGVPLGAGRECKPTASTNIFAMASPGTGPKAKKYWIKGLLSLPPIANAKRVVAKSSTCKTTKMVADFSDKPYLKVSADIR